MKIKIIYIFNNEIICNLHISISNKKKLIKHFNKLLKK